MWCPDSKRNGGIFKKVLRKINKVSKKGYG
jgi:hypothetical protein